MRALHIFEEENVMEINVAWLYPDILNLHGDRGNVMALQKIAEAMGLQLNTQKVDASSSPQAVADADLILMGAGQLRDIKYVTEDMRRYRDTLEAYVQQDGYMLVTGSTGCILGKKYMLDDNRETEGLGLINMAAKALNRTKMPMLTREVYGDDIDWVTQDGMEIAGCQIQRMDFRLGKNTEPWGKLIYGYGNNCTDGTEGARYKNLMFTNTVGPLLSCNPWLGVDILQKIAAGKGTPCTDFDPESIPFMQYAREGMKRRKEFIRTKKKLPNICDRTAEH